jgi:repressor LexA
MLAFEVAGDSMLPRYDDGDAIIVWKEQRRALETFYGEEAAVRTRDGARYLKIIRQGKSRSVVTLESFNAKPIENVRLEWLGEIYMTMRAGQLRRIEHQEAAAARRRESAREKKGAGTIELPLTPRRGTR